MARETIYTAKTSFTTVSTANPYLDGSGPMNSLLVANSNGTIIKTIIIKAQESTTQGMLRFFIKNGGGTTLFAELNVNTVTDSPRDPAYYNVLSLDYFLQAGDEMLVSTEVGNKINIIAECLDVSYYSTFREDTVYYTAKTGVGYVNTGNSNLDGSGAINTILQVDSGTGISGCLITSILVKGQQTTTPGMVRLFISPNGGSTWVLFAELPIPAITQGATLQSFSREIISFGGLTLQEGYSIGASTQVDETFSVIISSSNWQYLN